MRPHVVHARQSCLLQLPRDPPRAHARPMPASFSFLRAPHRCFPPCSRWHQVAASRPALSRPPPTGTGAGTGAAAGTSEEAAGAPVSDPILALLDEFGHTSQGRTGRRGSSSYSRPWDSRCRSRCLLLPSPLSSCRGVCGQTTPRGIEHEAGLPIAYPPLCMAAPSPSCSPMPSSTTTSPTLDGTCSRVPHSAPPSLLAQ
jgi:hypothetical protein